MIALITRIMLGLLPSLIISTCAGMLLISEWWASEIMTILGGLLPDAERQLSAIAIYTTTNAMCFMLSLGLSTAVSTRWGFCRTLLDGV